MNKQTILIPLLLSICCLISAQKLQIVPIQATSNLKIYDVIIANVDNQNHKEVLLSFDKSSIVNIHTLEPTEDSFRKTENEIGDNGGALAVADFSGDGQIELIIARGEVNLFQSCSTHSFCFEKK